MPFGMVLLGISAIEPDAAILMRNQLNMHAQACSSMHLG
jgi:hypothetical protein